MRTSRLLAVGLVALALAAAACTSRARSDADPSAPATYGPCEVGPVDNQPMPIAATSIRPDVVDASRYQTTTPIKHVVFIMKENRTFDNFFGLFPGANGTTTGMVNGKTIPLSHCFPQQLDHDILHDYPSALMGWNHGKMDGFGNVSPFARQWAYIQAQQKDIPNYWHWAQEYALGDNFFSSVLGPSWPNHLFSIAATSAGAHDNPVETPASAVHAQERGLAKSWGCDALGGEYILLDQGKGPPAKAPPCVDVPTVPDLLEAKHIPWASYSASRNQEGYIWNAPDYVKHLHESVRYETHVFPVDQLVPDIQDGRLPPVTWITPQFWLSDHPDANICEGENWTTQVVDEIMRSPMWKDTAIFISWDDWGGFYDHVAPTQIDKFGLGFRVPDLVISPYAKQGFIDHERGEFSSILRFIEDNWGLSQLTERDKHTNNMTQNFNFAGTPRAPDPLPLRTDCQAAHQAPPP